MKKTNEAAVSVEILKVFSNVLDIKNSVSSMIQLALEPLGSHVRTQTSKYRAVGMVGHLRFRRAVSSQRKDVLFSTWPLVVFLDDILVVNELSSTGN